MASLSMGLPTEDLTTDRTLGHLQRLSRTSGEVIMRLRREFTAGPDPADVADSIRPLATIGHPAMVKTTDDVLAEVPLFAGLSKDDLREVGSLATRLSLSKGWELTRQGGRGHEFIIVLEGTVDVLIDDEVVATCGAGNFFGEIALLEDGQRVATVVAKTDVVIDVIGRGEFSMLMAEYPQIGETVRAAMEQRLSENAADEDETTTGS